MTQYLLRYVHPSSWYYLLVPAIEKSQNLENTPVDFGVLSRVEKA